MCSFFACYLDVLGLRLIQAPSIIQRTETVGAKYVRGRRRYLNDELKLFAMAQLCRKQMFRDLTSTTYVQVHMIEILLVGLSGAPEVAQLARFPCCCSVSLRSASRCGVE